MYIVMNQTFLLLLFYFYYDTQCHIQWRSCRAQAVVGNSVIPMHMSYLGAPEVLGQLQLGQLQLIKWLIMLRYIYIQFRRDSREVKGSSRL